jgi:hypothetical protein
MTRCGVFDPKGFDLNWINRDWKGAKRRGRWPIAVTLRAPHAAP